MQAATIIVLIVYSCFFFLCLLQAPLTTANVNQRICMNTHPFTCIYCFVESAEPSSPLIVSVSNDSQLITIPNCFNLNGICHEMLQIINISSNAPAI
jgi:hypothetical protein